jgi:hypothetical protein
VQRLQFTVAAQKRRESQGQRHAAQFIARGVVIRRARARNESVTGRTGQVECRQQRPHGLDMRSTALPTLQRAHRVNRQARNRRELFLGITRRRAERFELRAK